MSDIVIKAEGLGKKYLIGHQQERERYTALRDVIARSLRGTARKARQVFSGQQLIQGDSVEEFWALRDLDFEIKQGDRVGIIGRNGAGKSTLLKILSRITEPSTGKVTIKGRVASLLEVGTGFHPELTGRENIFLNGAILGMSRAEIKKKFDEIVAFAEVEKFLDTPVKRYSSGMYVRLAFAVAAHLEPEILIVDEVLAVGDAQFQKKCLGKMEDVSKNEGRTVLFVSHNMRAIQNICENVLVFNQGVLEYAGDKLKGLAYYERLNQGEIKAANSNIQGDHFLKFDFLFNSTEGNKGVIEIIFYAVSEVKECYVNVCFDTPDGTRISHIRNDWAGIMVSLKKGTNIIKIQLEQLNLANGIYDVWTRLYFKDGNKIFDSNLIPIEISNEVIYGFMSLESTWLIEYK